MFIYVHLEGTPVQVEILEYSPYIPERRTEPFEPAEEEHLEFQFVDAEVDALALYANLYEHTGLHDLVMKAFKESSY